MLVAVWMPPLKSLKRIQQWYINTVMIIMYINTVCVFETWNTEHEIHGDMKIAWGTNVHGEIRAVRMHLADLPTWRLRCLSVSKMAFKKLNPSNRPLRWQWEGEGFKKTTFFTLTIICSGWSWPQRDSAGRSGQRGLANEPRLHLIGGNKLGFGCMETGRGRLENWGHPGQKTDREKKWIQHKREGDTGNHSPSSFITSTCT